MAEKRVEFIHNSGFVSNYRVSIAEIMEAKGKGKIKDYTKKEPKPIKKDRGS